MFGFLKKKIQEAINSFKKADLPDEKGEPKEDEIEKEKKTKKETTQKEEQKHIKDKQEYKKQEQKKEDKHKESREITDKQKEKKEIKKINEPHKKEEKDEKQERKQDIKQEIKEVSKDHESEKQEKKGLFDRIGEFFSTTTISEQKFEELFYDLEIALLENNVALEVIDKIKQDLKNELVNKKLPKGNIEKKVIDVLKNSIESLFDVEKINLIEKIKEKKHKTGNPYIILMIGINGSGKTTTIAKLVNLFKKNNLTCVIGACDTFRAAAIQQLEEHANKLNVKLIKHDYGSDPAAVAFDTVQHAKAKNIDVVLIDTAGRLHSNTNLMVELEKIIRVVKPDFKLFIGESIAGNDVVEQVKLFNEKSGIDGIILSKADVDEKGGSAISVSYVTGKPILYLGTGQNYDDLIEFDKEKILGQIF